MAYLKTSATLLDQLTDGSGNFLVTSVGVTPTTTALSASAVSRETRHLMSSPANARELDEAIAEIEVGNVTEFRP